MIGLGSPGGIRLYKFRANARGGQVTAEARTRLHQHLRVSGASAVTGFLIAFLHGQLVPELERFHLGYRGLVLGNKLEAMRQPLRSNAPPIADGGLNVTTHPIADLQRQITKMMPGYLRERAVPVPGKSPTVIRMREPYHSMYLMWLARRCLADLIVVDGAFYYNGGLELRECYAEDKDGTPALSNRFQSTAATQGPRRPSKVRHQPQAKPRSVQRNQSVRRARRRALALFPNPAQVLKRRDDIE